MELNKTDKAICVLIIFAVLYLVAQILRAVWF